MFATSSHQKYQMNPSLSSENLLKVNLQEQYPNRDYYLQKNLSPSMKNYEVNFQSTSNELFSNQIKLHKNQQKMTEFQKFQFTNAKKIIQSQQYTFKMTEKPTIQSPSQTHFQNLQTVSSNQQSERKIFSPKLRTSLNCGQNKYFYGYSKKISEDMEIEKECKYSSKILSNSIYLKSFNQSYQPIEYHSPKIKINPHFYESTEKYPERNFLYPVSPHTEILKQSKSTMNLQNQIPKELFERNQINNLLTNQKSVHFDFFENKSPKQTRQGSEIGTESNRKKNSSELIVQEQILPQFNLDLQNRKQVKSYLYPNKQFAFESLINNRKNKISFQKKNNRNQNKISKSPSKQKILIQEYDEQNEVLEEEIEGLENQIQYEIQKERILLDKLNSMMEKLQILKEKQVQTQNYNIDSYLAQKLSSESTLLSRNQENQRYNVKKNQQSASNKQKNRQINSCEKQPYLKSQKSSMIRSMESQEKENANIFLSPKPKKLPNLKKDKNLFNNISNILPNIDESVNQNFSEQVKKEHQCVDSSFSVFESKYVPKITNFQKLKELQETFEEQLKKGFSSTNLASGLNNDPSRKQKLKLLSRQIKQLRQLISQEDLSHFDE